MARRVVHNSTSTHHHPLFSSGLELADLVVSSGLLHCSLEAISALHDDFDSNSNSGVTDEFSRFSIRYRIYYQHQEPAQNYTVIAFAYSQSNQRDGEFFIPSASLEQNSSLFEFLYSKDNPSFSINQEALTLFISLFDQLSRLHQQLGDANNPLIITGHSLGGSVASLFTLWLLENIPPSPSTTNLPFCITYGSPLIGDHGFQQAISDRQTWNHRFLHVVSDHDIVPRLFMSRQNSLPNVNSNLEAGSYKPFGTFLMCSQSGCACFEDPETVLDLMAAMESEIGRTQDSSEGLHVGVSDYGEVLEHLKSTIITKEVSEFQGLSTSPRAEIVLQLQAIGLKKSEQRNSNYDYLIAAMENREKANYVSHRRRISDPTKKLNEIKIHMAYLEWYKKVSKAARIGYYDTYKIRETKQDMDVVKYKNFLTNYWINMVREAERKPQKQGVSFRARWLGAGTNYRRMVEPLDIADYYKIPGNTEYQTQGRKHHYIVLQKWQEVEKAAMDQNKAKTRKTASSLTEDSCFWAYVEDAIISCKSLKNDEEASNRTEEPARRNLMEFEGYVMDLLNNFAVSPEIFLEKSSFMQWWKEYETTLDQQYSSPLTEFMKNGHYKQYA